MYKTALPLMAKTAIDKQDEFFDIIKRCHIDRLFFTVDRAFRKDETENNVELIKKCIEIYKSTDCELCLWIGSSVGHYYNVNAEDYGFTELMDLNGKAIKGCYCPSDKKFQQQYSEYVSQFANLDLKFIMLDDDLRLSQHSETACCVCHNHLLEIEKILGERVTIEQVKESYNSGKENKIRSAFIKANANALSDFASAIRKQVDKVNKNMPVSVCSVASVWNQDGLGCEELNGILQNDTHKYLRTHGAPFWARDNMALSYVIESALAYKSFVNDKEYELFAEGDVYPRPSFYTSPAMLELYDAIMRANNYDGILKYMVDYVNGPYFDMAYVNAHIKDYADLLSVSNMFEGGKPFGVQVMEYPFTAKVNDCNKSAIPQGRFAGAGTLLGNAGVPFSFENDSSVCAVFGSNSEYADISDKKTVILDAVSAWTYFEKGIDVGVNGNFNYVSLNGASETAGEYLYSLGIGASGKILDCTLLKNAKVLSTVSIGGKDYPLAYSYKNAKGQNFLVYLMSVETAQIESGLLRGFIRKAQINDTLKEFGFTNIAVIEGASDVFTVVKEFNDGYAVLMCNFFASNVIKPIIKLDKKYKKIKCIRCKGKLKGDTVILNGDIPALDFIAFRLYK